MITESIKTKILTIWDKYVADSKKVQDTKGKEIDNIDENRIEAIITLKIIVNDFLIDRIDISEFKTDIDSFNKQNNFWGFTSIKGQMFFNLLVKTANTDEQLIALTNLLKECITEPSDLNDGLNKIEKLYKYTFKIFNNAPDKRKAPNPGSICYFLSYFWQISNHEKWPIMYSSIILSLTEIGLWTDQPTPNQSYSAFFNLYDEIKQLLASHTKRYVTNWEAEHAFWNFKTITAYPKQAVKVVKTPLISIPVEVNKPVYKASFDIYEYIIPALAKLIEFGNETEKSSSAKGVLFEKTVCEIFNQIGFDVNILGQGTGRNPDAIITFKQEHVAFIVDAKAYGSGYSLGLDDRAIREYIYHHCRLLKSEGFTKIGFIIVSNSFKTNFESFVSDITWNTEIKRFVLLESEALLHLLAYKNKEKLPINQIIESIVSFGNKITAQKVIQEFDDI